MAECCYKHSDIVRRCCCLIVCLFAVIVAVGGWPSNQLCWFIISIVGFAKRSLLGRAASTNISTIIIVETTQRNDDCTRAAI